LLGNFERIEGGASALGIEPAQQRRDAVEAGAQDGKIFLGVNRGQRGSF
jgi:hypothetical protein